MGETPLVSYKSTTQLLARSCVSLYPAVLEAVYKETRPKLNLDTIVKEDEWRYEELPKALLPGDSLSKKQLAKLVNWKITHGHFRPFLPGMINKNTEDEVREHTSKASSLLKNIAINQAASDIVSAVEAALTQVCSLKGVGPATGTLVLSVFQSEIVPFFEDELFYWLNPDHAAKLKYDKKEYKVILNRALQIMMDEDIKAQDLEKTAYVLMHADKLSDEEKRKLGEATRREASSKVDERQDKPVLSHEPQVTNVSEVGTATREKPQKPRKPSPSAREDSDVRRSKRRKI